MAYLSATYETFNLDETVATTETVTLVYSDSLTCAQIEALLTNLTTEQALAKRADCATTVPAPAAGTHWEVWDCSGGGSTNPPPEGTYVLDGDPIQAGDDGSEQSNDSLN